MSEPTTPAADEQATKDELLFALHHRDKPTLAFVECKSTAKRDELAHCLPAELPEYQFYTLDVTPLPVASLVRTLSEHLPDHVKNSPPVTYVVNVYGLENRLDEQLAAQLNLERELLFRSVPYITVVWADDYFFRRLQRLAPDLWHWVTYKFRFDDPTVPAPEQQAPLPPARLPQKGNIDERQQRIQELEERYSHLDLDDSNKLRLLREKVNTLSLLADEYTEAFAYDKAIERYQLALALDKEVQEESVRERQRQAALSGREQTGKVEVDNAVRARLLYSLGIALLQARLLPKALEVYEQSLAIQSEKRHGITYHQIGMVHAEQRQWDEALYNYQQALRWNEKTGNNFLLGSTYHQIGMMYAEQEQWVEALANYQQALNWKEKTNNLPAMGATYHQLGRVYEEQQQWEKATDNYQQAIKWDEQTNSTFSLGTAYHQIGLVYEKQQKWKEALANHQQALKWKEKVGNTFALGGTYHQIGRVYAEQGRWLEARRWFKRSVKCLALHTHPNLHIAEASLAHLQKQISLLKQKRS